MKKILKDFTPMAGHHCITNSLLQVFKFNKIIISEEMLFGLGLGLGFTYQDAKNMPFPVISGRTKLIEFEDNIARNTGLDIEIKESSSKRRAHAELIHSLDENQPQIVYVDMGKLEYLNLPEDFHHGGHTVVVFGVDEEEGNVYVSDRDSKTNKLTEKEDEEPLEYHIITLDELAKARNSKNRPYPPKNKRVVIHFNKYFQVDRNILYNIIEANCNVMLNPPSKNLGVMGIQHFREALSDWEQFDDEKLNMASINMFFMINELGGTGGGCFRRLYGNFLRETAEFTKETFFKHAGAAYVKIADDWDDVGNHMMDLSQNCDLSLIPKIQNTLQIIHIREKELLERLQEYIIKSRKKLSY
jgi:Butirosin biosynthesis protein H, N-terminal/Domain of unknown function (DUF4872)